MCYVIQYHDAILYHTLCDINPVQVMLTNTIPLINYDVQCLMWNANICAFIILRHSMMYCSNCVRIHSTTTVSGALLSNATSHYSMMYSTYFIMPCYVNLCCTMILCYVTPCHAMSCATSTNPYGLNHSVQLTLSITYLVDFRSECDVCCCQL
jgi:hypothetical protein